MCIYISGGNRQCIGPICDKYIQEGIQHGMPVDKLGYLLILIFCLTVHCMNCITSPFVIFSIINNTMLK